ncbi:MAG TPA: TetR/AcrR family transcriptional regulator [Syntrophales bacterium]|nr:TetR/AcrR family transcriptional regulator [Syntrophales bacterium]
MKNIDKREAIIAAALELIAEHGFHGAPMAMIAEKAGVGAGTIYRYFDNKDVLITELYRELEEKLLAALREGYPAGKPMRDRFLHIGTKLLRYCISHPLYFRYMEQYHNSPYGAKLRKDRIINKSGGQHMFKTLMEEGTAQRVVKDLPLFVHFALAFGPVISLARDHVLGLIKLDDDLIVKSIAACWDGIRR